MIKFREIINGEIYDTELSCFLGSSDIKEVDHCLSGIIETKVRVSFYVTTHGTYFCFKQPKMFLINRYYKDRYYIHIFGKYEDGKKLMMSYLEMYDTNLLEKLFVYELKEA
jgi:hypothetical protein